MLSATSAPSPPLNVLEPGEEPDSHAVTVSFPSPPSNVPAFRLATESFTVAAVEGTEHTHAASHRVVSSARRRSSPRRTPRGIPHGRHRRPRCLPRARRGRSRRRSALLPCRYRRRHRTCCPRRRCARRCPVSAFGRSKRTVPASFPAPPSNVDVLTSTVTRSSPFAPVERAAPDAVVPRLHQRRRRTCRTRLRSPHRSRPRR